MTKPLGAEVVGYALGAHPGQVGLKRIAIAVELAQAQHEVIAAMGTAFELALVAAHFENLDTVDTAQLGQIAGNRPGDGQPLARDRDPVLHAGKTDLARVYARGAGKRLHGVLRVQPGLFDTTPQVFAAAGQGNIAVFIHEKIGRACP